ncbi:hypothetical protein HU200_052755 [Digitaria exilis]|uniref:histidinol-phosphate transaminase n=1 Tax=Digitaria exilis TaxID=1010633 RepID=A0A835E5L1_9POAL|nr:hypothetical protein HU200_052755 [Digitaria exilis]
MHVRFYSSIINQLLLLAKFKLQHSILVIKVALQKIMLHGNITRKRVTNVSRVISDAGLAGLRVGYEAFPLSIIEYVWRAKQPYNISVAAEVSACATLQNPAYLEVTSGKDAKKIKGDLAKIGLMIRHCDTKEMKGYIRSSAGKPEHTDALIEGLKAVLQS